MDRRPAPPIGLLVACAALGGLLDFVFNGVFKIVWIALYGPAYVVAGKILEIQLAKTRYGRASHFAVAALLFGALLLHVTMTGHRSKVEYSMRLQSSDPIILRSDDWPQRFFVSSPRISRHLAESASALNIPVVIARISDYGCTRSFTVESIAGVSIVGDAETRWTWKANLPWGAPAPSAGPGHEDQALPWCWIKFYRS